MKMELIPTVQSLLKQDAIRVEGDIALIEAFTKLIDLLSFQYEHPPVFDFNSYPFLDHSARKIPLLSDSINRPLSQQVLYSISLQPERFEVLVHIHSDSTAKPEYTTKPVYTVRKPNLSNLNHALHALYDYIDDSTHFLICQNCKQLVAAELCSDNSCGDFAKTKHSAQHCESTYKQVFDTSFVDRVSITGEVVNVFKGEDEIKFYASSTAWPHPHEPQCYSRVIETLPLTATLDEVHALRDKLEAEQKYPAPCFHCKEEFDEGEAMDLASFVDFDTDEIVCYGCASLHYGVVY
ncbi:hypothetical protein L2719_19935 [Shewanella schlegeliana]|uniref:Uncharacterized protein n=1 Tax=Shewanella schlegeliana TaxID=190308 RepID=A0ABS1T3W7_9GAMM|nr:hypothetical protein [Shewanella schlegeliana]MBL4915483.1 hypothetical protein [Shewanella schlegeliana]MCL1111796.1 hypothetical protein [Shewanella schlegeliana]GIU36561.1 hypothetical protein TUM4433_35520 [Shewanella schlegeliana]